MAKLTTNQCVCLDIKNLKSFIPEDGEPERRIKLLFDDKYCKACVTHEEMCIQTLPHETVIVFDSSKLLASGVRKLYFLCPYCAGRVEKLYFRNGFKCRKCANLIYPQQALSKCDLPRYRMLKLYKKLAPASNYDATNIMYAHIPPHPKHMRTDEYYKTVLDFLKARGEDAENFLNYVRRKNK